MTELRDNGSGLSIIVSRGTIPHRFTIRGFDRLPPAAKSAEVELPKADEAVKYLGEVLDKNGPLYDLKTQRCVTHVCDVLRHGGIDVPNEPGAQIKYILRLLK